MNAGFRFLHYDMSVDSIAIPMSPEGRRVHQLVQQIIESASGFNNEEDLLHVVFVGAHFKLVGRKE